MELSIETFQTEDLHLAAYLIASGKSRLQAILNGDSWKKSFELSPPPNDGDIAGYYTGNAEVSALRLCEQLRSLKTAIKYSMENRIKENENSKACTCARTPR